jgi:hypothetical protein
MMYDLPLSQSPGMKRGRLGVIRQKAQQASHWRKLGGRPAGVNVMFPWRDELRQLVTTDLG